MRRLLSPLALTALSGVLAALSGCEPPRRAATPPSQDSATARARSPNVEGAEGLDAAVRYRTLVRAYANRIREGEPRLDIISRVIPDSQFKASALSGSDTLLANGQSLLDNVLDDVSACISACTSEAATGTMKAYLEASRYIDGYYAEMYLGFAESISRQHAPLFCEQYAAEYDRHLGDLHRSVCL